MRSVLLNGRDITRQIRRFQTGTRKRRHGYSRGDSWRSTEKEEENRRRFVALNRALLCPVLSGEEPPRRLPGKTSRRPKADVRPSPLAAKRQQRLPVASPRPKRGVSTPWDGFCAVAPAACWRPLG